MLKGHISLGALKFPHGTSGCNMDAFARRFLWDNYADFAHGTGHGVGSFLAVHEGPQSINKRNNFPLMKGMIVSNEPGYYENGAFGIRIENLVYIKDAEKSGFYEFENLTLVPYAKELINFDDLDKNEMDYIKKYYSKIHEFVSPKLSARGLNWLNSALTLDF